MHPNHSKIKWEKVYIFISSTFNDMHGERDYLIKRVFPQLAEWCERRKLRMVDIDLRWGVTEVDATRNKNVVSVCLDRVDECRPFFLCFMGQRRGWVPTVEDLSEHTVQRFPGLKKYTGLASITELEILHAIVEPLHNDSGTTVSNQSVLYNPVEHAFFSSGMLLIWMTCRQCLQSFAKPIRTSGYRMMVSAETRIVCLMTGSNG